MRRDIIIVTILKQERQKPPSVLVSVLPSERGLGVSSAAEKELWSALVWAQPAELLITFTRSTNGEGIITRGEEDTLHRSVSRFDRRYDYADRKACLN